MSKDSSLFEESTSYLRVSEVSLWLSYSPVVVSKVWSPEEAL
jgi:hypothetical protein